MPSGKDLKGYIEKTGADIKSIYLHSVPNGSTKKQDAVWLDTPKDSKFKEVKKKLGIVQSFSKILRKITTMGGLQHFWGLNAEGSQHFWGENNIKNKISAIELLRVKIFRKN